MEDGLYGVTLIAASGNVTYVSAERLADPGPEPQMPPADPEDEGWTPTQEEIASYGHFIDFAGLEEDEESGLEDDGGASGADGSGM